MAVDASVIARVVGVETKFQDLRGGAALFLPQRVAVIAQGNSAATYSTEPFQSSSAPDVGSRFGFGSPAHLIARMLFPANGDGLGSIPATFYPMEDDASGVTASGTITPSGSATEQASYRVVVNNIRSEAFVLETSDAVADITAKITAAINAVLEMPVIATDNATAVGIDAKWAGLTGNDIFLEVVGEDVGVTFTIVQPTGGDVNPDVQAKLDQIGSTWETLIINALNDDDTTALDAISTWNEGRWGATVRKPAVAFVGNTESDVATAITVTDARKTDRTNVQLVSPGSDDLPFVVAARQVARIARVANNNPPRGYAGQRATLLTPGATGDQWTLAERDQAIKGGSSTVEVTDGEVVLSNVVTMYHPTGEPNPAYRHVRNIVKLQNILFNIGLIFESDTWKGAPLIPDGQATVNSAARKPSAAVAAVNALHDSLALNAIISDPEGAKESTEASIDSGNPDRLNLDTTVKLSGNTDVISATLNFGFFFGTAAAA